MWVVFDWCGTAIAALYDELEARAMAEEEYQAYCVWYPNLHHEEWVAA